MPTTQEVQEGNKVKIIPWQLKRHKCHSCGASRQARFMCSENLYETVDISLQIALGLADKKNHKYKVRWTCGDCSEENRGKR